MRGFGLRRVGPGSDDGMKVVPSIILTLSPGHVCVCVRDEEEFGRGGGGLMEGLWM